MLLKIAERIMLYSLLPKMGDVVSLRTIRDLQQELSFSDDERTAINLEIKPNGLVSWKLEAEFEKDVLFSDFAISIICEALNQADKKKSLGIELLDLYDRFMQEQVSRKNHKA